MMEENEGLEELMEDVMKLGKEFGFENIRTILMAFAGPILRSATHVTWTPSRASVRLLLESDNFDLLSTREKSPPHRCVIIKMNVTVSNKRGVS